MATRRKQPTASREASRKFEGISDLLSKLEVEAEKIVRRVVEKAEQSSRELKSSISDIVHQIRTTGIASVASEKREDLRRLVEDILDRAKEIQFLPLSGLSRDEIIHEAKKNLEDLVDRLNASDFLARAKATANSTKNQVLSILSIPSQSEVIKLSRKITNLESRVSKMTRKAA